jgi:hypothetical protein
VAAAVLAGEEDQEGVGDQKGWEGEGRQLRIDIGHLDRECQGRELGRRGRVSSLAGCDPYGFDRFRLKSWVVCGLGDRWSSFNKLV